MSNRSKPEIGSAKMNSSLKYCNLNTLFTISNLIIFFCFIHQNNAASLGSIEPEIASSPSKATAASADVTKNVPMTSSKITQLNDKVNSPKDGLVDHLDTQETGFMHGPAPYGPATGADNGYDYDKNAYGKQAADWSLYDQGNHGHYDRYGDKAWNEHGHNGQSSHGKHDSYGQNYNNQQSNHGSGYYSRDRGYGYEKHYAYDKEVASKQHADNHNAYGSNHGLHDYYGNTESKTHGNQGHDKYGQLSRYGNHGYGKRGAHLNAHHDYEHQTSKYHTSPTYNTHHHQSYGPHSSYHQSEYHVPTYRSTYNDYSPQVGYPSSYPSYY